MTTETIQQKRERRNELARETRALLDRVSGADWSDEHQRQYDENLAQIEQIDAEINREQRLLDLEAEQRFEQLDAGRREEIEASPLRSLFNKWLRGGDNALTAEDWQTVRGALSTGVDSEGGYTVPEEWATEVLEALAAFGGMRAVANIITTSSGVPINYPTSDGTQEEGEVVAENQEATEEDPSFGTVALGVFKYSSKVIAVPFELLQDSAVDVEAFVRNRLQMRLGRITNRHYTVGTGAGQPTGIVTASPAGKVGATAATAEILYDDIVDLEHSVDPAYRNMGNTRWMMHDQTLKLVRKIKDDQGRPLFLPSYDAGIRGGVPPELAGHPITINQHMAEPAPDAISLLFGDFRFYTIRDTMQMQLFRFTDSAYTKRGQVGFLAWMRTGGNFVDVGGAVKHFQHGPAA